MRISDWSSDVCSSDLLEIQVPDGLDALDGADIIIVPAWNDPHHSVPASLREALQPANADGKLIVGLCLGAFVLGEAGLLEGKEATTHWIARDEFARRFPNTKFRPDVLYVADGTVIPSAGPVAAIRSAEHTSELQSRMRHSY